MRMWRNAARVAVAASLIGASIAATGAPTAAAAGASLKIEMRTRESCVWMVTGSSSSYLPGGRVEARLWGDDPVYDDFVAGPISLRYDGRYFYGWSGINCWALGEDWDGVDELYAGVRVYDSSGRQRETLTTGVVSGNW